MSTTFAGAWREGSDGLYLWDDGWDGFRSKWEELGKKDLRLVDLETYRSGGSQRWVGAWREGSDGYYLWVNVDWDGLVAKWKELAAKGLRLVNVESWVEGESVRWAGVWREGTDGYYLWADTWDGFTRKWEELSDQNQRLVDIETYRAGGGDRVWCGVWREGSDGHYLWCGVSWDDFVAKWEKLGSQNLRLVDVEAYEEDGAWKWAGVWREGSDGYYLWSAPDYENFLGKWNELGKEGLRLVSMTPIPESCGQPCGNLVVSRDENWEPLSYVYSVTGDPDGPYSWPVADDEYARVSTLTFDDRPFTLPFSNLEVGMGGPWLYGPPPNDWHHAIDYSRSGGATFQVLSAAAGTVAFVGYDDWSGNTIIVSHDVGGQADSYRTIYMHLRNGPAHDCDHAWSDSVPLLQAGVAAGWLDAGSDTTYQDYLADIGCPQDPNLRDPDEAFWGIDDQAIDPNLVGASVDAGDHLAWAGCTGPGGCGCVGSGARDTPNTHLHIFFCRRDPADGQWYFIDPYGIYAYHSDCYPTGVAHAASGSCVRYSVAWKGGKPQYPPGAAMDALISPRGRRRVAIGRPGDPVTLGERPFAGVRAKAALAKISAPGRPAISRTDRIDLGGRISGRLRPG